MTNQINMRDLINKHLEQITKEVPVLLKKELTEMGCKNIKINADTSTCVCFNHITNNTSATFTYNKVFFEILLCNLGGYMLLKYPGKDLRQPSRKNILTFESLKKNLITLSK